VLTSRPPEARSQRSKAVLRGSVFDPRAGVRQSTKHDNPLRRPECRVARGNRRRKFRRFALCDPQRAGRQYDYLLRRLRITLGGPLPVTHTLTIDGGLPGRVVIDGASTYRAFFVDTGTVTLNLKIQNAKAQGGAPGIFTATVNGENAPVSYFGAQGSYPRLDQINRVRCMSSAGTGLINIVITAKCSHGGHSVGSEWRPYPTDAGNTAAPASDGKMELLHGVARTNLPPANSSRLSCGETTWTNNDWNCFTELWT
jgi:hypothetical protein